MPALAVAASALAVQLPAQKAESDAPPRTVALRCELPPLARDSERVVVYATLAPESAEGDRPHAAGQRAQLTLLLQELRPAIRVPQPLRLVVGASTLLVPPVEGDTSTRKVPSPENRVAFTLHVDGTVTNTVVVQPSVGLGLDTALLRAIEHASAGGILAGMLIGFGGNQPSGAPDSLRLSLGISLHPDTSIAVVPLFRSWLPAYDLVPVIPDRRNRPPSYPAAARRLGLPGEVVLEFIVDTAGRAELRTVRVLEARVQEFVDAAARTLGTWRFRPATINDCPARMLVRQRFTFRLE